MTPVPLTRRSTPPGLTVGLAVGCAAGFTLLCVLWFSAHRYLTRTKRARKEAARPTERRWLQAGLNPAAAVVAQNDAIDDEIRRQGGTQLPQYPTQQQGDRETDDDADLPRYEEGSRTERWG